MKTKITHNKPEQTATTLLAGGRLTYKPADGSTVTVICNGDNARVITETEPEPIPMDTMRPGDVGVVASVKFSGLVGNIGDLVTCACDGEFCMRHRDGKMIARHGYTVRLLQPGESLVIEVVDDVRAASDAVAESENNPTTLDAALRTGTADEIVAAAERTTAAGGKAEAFARAVCGLHNGEWIRHLPVNGYFETMVLSGAVTKAMLGMIDHVHDRDLSVTPDWFVELRDRLDLFGGNDGD